VQQTGHETEHAVFLLHGTPGSRLGPRPRSQVLYELGVRLISFDRPGYGRSQRLESRTVADVVPDVRAIADEMGIEKFAVIGRSGGGPHALACAALLPERVTRAAVLVGLAPPDAEGLDWFAGMTASNVREYTSAATDPEAMRARLIQAGARIRANPVSHMSTLAPEMPTADRRVMADVGIKSLIVRTQVEAIRDESCAGWIDDVLAFVSPWGFSLADIEVPVLLWHGLDDVFSPVGHTRWLAERIRKSTLSIQPGKAHLDAIEVMPDVLSWLTRQD
jgi:pimeloyl-ACP methyl ester carboxylesterase